MATIAELIAKPTLPLGTLSLKLISCSHRSDDGRISMLFGSDEYDGLASISVMPDQLDWILPIWIKAFDDEVSIDMTTDFDSDFDMRESIVSSINKAKLKFFDVVVKESDAPVKEGQKPLFNGTFA